MIIQCWLSTCMLAIRTTFRADNDLKLKRSSVNDLFTRQLAFCWQHRGHNASCRLQDSRGVTFNNNQRFAVQMIVYGQKPGRKSSMLGQKTYFKPRKAEKPQNQKH